MARITSVEGSGTAVTVTKVCVPEIGRKSSVEFSGWAAVSLAVLKAAVRAGSRI